ncbi:hypothetical protein CONCODRAFT_80674 [Conidiobolus coronatus NRRL 28638]|uniref:Uncharacterized protein n=1 Tax=Conidiobolus coronatus (strain ATCC 28846 / CBS 209.66 / NRRL 28638) TaxID=796925 RepID=A0A137NT23_CONC2|nr:hypothetical protein CONCODRAFT_80674 [Conidiobolus coronatus NRRL 28638]|eukprot:KXN65834.1 hypothetical protein CONCODRAFT_80674 [Conidiobolus coronatus NRRL 28638]
MDRDEGYNSDDGCDYSDTGYRQRAGANRLRSQSSPQPLKETLPSKRQLSTKLLLTREVQDFKQKLQSLSLIQLINYYEYIFLMERKQTHSNLDPKALRKILLGAVHRYGSSSVIRDQILWNARGYIYLSPCNLGNPIYLKAPDSNFGLNRIWSRRPLLDYFGSKHSLS